MATGQVIHHAVYSSLREQVTRIDIIPCVTDGVINSSMPDFDPRDHQRKIESEVNSRNLISKILRENYTDHGFVGMQDSDIVHLQYDNYERGMQYLEENPGYVGVVFAGRNTHHLKHQAGVWRTSFLRSYRWNLDTAAHHICTNLREDIAKTGMKYGYLPSTTPLIEEL